MPRSCGICVRPSRCKVERRGEEDGESAHAYSVSLTFLRSIRRFDTRALMTSAASDSVRVSTSWNSPRLMVVDASSLPAAIALAREV